MPQNLDSKFQIEDLKESGISFFRKKVRFGVKTLIWALVWNWCKIPKKRVTKKEGDKNGVEKEMPPIGSSSIYRGELSFLPLVQFCICLHDGAILTGYLFRQGPACVHVLNWKNVLQVSGVIRCVWHFANWKNVLCHKMSMCMAFC